MADSSSVPRIRVQRQLMAVEKEVLALKIPTGQPLTEQAYVNALSGRHLRTSVIQALHSLSRMGLLDRSTSELGELSWRPSEKSKD